MALCARCSAGLPVDVQFCPKCGAPVATGVDAAATVTQVVLSAGDRLGPYQIEAALGAGGMGEVFRAADTRLNRVVAIKVLPRDKVADPDRKRRFLQEARAASALNHPNIVTLYDLATDRGSDYLVMEYVAGTPLDKLLAAKSLPLSEALAYLAQIASALAAAHTAGIVHRDIKPANIIVTAEGQVKILDFGLAKLGEGDAGQETLTQAGTVMGTVAYMSPEQAGARSLDHRTDIFSLGVVMYEMLTGRRPFSRKSNAETMSAIITAPHPPLTAAPTRVSEIVDKALEKDPRERYQTAGDMAVDLRRVQRSGPAVPAAGSPPVRSHPWIWIAAALALVAGAGAWYFSRGSAVSGNPLAGATLTRLTNFPGDELSAAISPDGKFVAFLSDRDGPMDLWRTQVGTGQFENLTKGSPVIPTPSNPDVGFTPDGSEIWLRGPPPPGQRLRRLPLIGGATRFFLGETAVMPRWSPNGARLAYFLNDPGDPIFVADANAANPRQIFRERPGVHNHFIIWSADGKWIYFVHGNVATSEMDLWRIAASGGQPEQLTQNNRYIGYPTPLDARTILYVAKDQDDAGPWLWLMDVERRTSRRVSFGLERYTSLAANGDGRRLVATVANPTTNLWTVPILDHPATEQEVKPYPLPTVRALAPRFGPAGLFYLSSQGSGDGLWRYAEGQASEIWKGSQGALLEAPAVSPDGLQVAIVLRRTAKQVLNVVSVDGSQVRPVAETLDVRGSPAWSPDGKWIAIGGSDATGAGLFKVPLDGGAPVRLSNEAGRNPAWSSAGNLIAFAGTNMSGREPLRAVRPDGTPVDLPPIPLSYNGERVRFLRDGSSLVYAIGETWQDFWLLDVAAKTSRPLTHLAHSGTMRSFDITPDGKQIVFDRIRENSDVVLIDLPARGK